MWVVKRSSDNALMPPPPPPKRQKRPSKVVDEDVYSDALSHIIARDFFPGLLETEAQQEYMSALDSNNQNWIRDAGRKLTKVMTPMPYGRRRETSFTPRRVQTTDETPRGYTMGTPTHTPKATPNPDSASDELRSSEVDVNMSLGAFQAKYTSEDNESFNALLDKQNETRSRDFAFFRQGNKILSARQIAHRKREQRLLTERGEVSSDLVVHNAAGEERKAVSLTGPSEDLDSRPASVDSFPNRQGSKNHFMFGPDGIEDQAISVRQEMEQKSLAPPKSVSYSATRFAPQDVGASASSVPPSPSISAIDAAIAGRSRPTESEPGYDGAETPRVNGYSFVDAEPTPEEMGVPVSDEIADDLEREATMKLLPKADEDGPNLFNVKEGSKREDLHRRLVEKADASRRKEKGMSGSRVERLRNLGITPAGRTPTPRFASGPAIGKGGMTPAARRLADRIGTPARKGDVFDSFGSKSRGAWTPASIVKPSV